MTYKKHQEIRKNISSIDEFIKYEKNLFLSRLEKFKPYYIEKNKNDPDEYPLTNDEHTQTNFGCLWSVLEQDLSEFYPDSEY